MHGIWRATQYHADDSLFIIGELVVRKNLTEGIQLAYSATNELCGLRTEIEYYYLLLHYILIISVFILYSDF